MLSRTTLIALFVAACFRSAENVKVSHCLSDEAFLAAASRLNTGIVPILVTKNSDTQLDADIKRHIGTRLRNVIQVNVDTSTGQCAGVVGYLKADTFPSVYVMKDNYLLIVAVRECTPSSLDSLMSSAQLDSARSIYQWNVTVGFSRRTGLIPPECSGLPAGTRREWAKCIGVDLVTSDGRATYRSKMNAKPSRRSRFLV